MQVKRMKLIQGSWRLDLDAITIIKKYQGAWENTQ